MESKQVNFGLRIAGCGFEDASIRNPKSAIRNSVALPRWWRRGLVALAVLLLCSCQAPLRVAQLDDFVDEITLPAGPEAVVSDRDPAIDRFEFRRPKPEVRALDPEDLAASQPLAMPYAMSGPIACPTCNHSSGLGGDYATCDAGAGDMATADGLVGPGDEYLCDGGDYGLPAGVRADWTVDGLEQEDAIAHYDTLDGRVVVTPSNRVCVYAPRFAAVRRVTGVEIHQRLQLPNIETVDQPLAIADENQPALTAIQRHALVTDRRAQPPILFRGRQQPGELEGAVAVIEAFNILPVYANHTLIRSGEVVGSEQAEVERAMQAAVTWTSDQAVQIVIDNQQAVAAVGLRQPGQVYMTTEPNSPKLRLVKLASTNHALPGEEVEFTLRFDSVGDQLIGNVTIVDNLATRLEYVPNSAKSSVAANFSAVPNAAGSTVLRWEITDPLEPGDGGILQFTARVR
jgi:uncharacterized repeat protein (TIGR01451 family)